MYHLQKIWSRLISLVATSRQLLHHTHRLDQDLPPARSRANDPLGDTTPGRLQIGMVAAFKSEYPAGFIGICTKPRSS
jgi:hypothetical protein